MSPYGQVIVTCKGTLMNAKRVKTFLFFCLSLAGLFAAPLGSQAQTQLTNPTAAEFGACGLPTTYASFNSAATVKTFNMTADCTFSNSQMPSYFGFLQFTEGTFIINGNGHSISGPTNGYVILVGSNGILNLNDVTIRQAGRTDTVAVILQNGGRLNGNNVIFRDNNNGVGVVGTRNGVGHIYLNDVQFLSNTKAAGSQTQYGTALTASTANSVAVITNGIFRGNSGFPDVIVARASGSSVRLEGCVIFENNVQTGGAAANNYGSYNGGAVTDNSDFSFCLAMTPKPKRKKEKIPTATATARPLATTCIDLNQATGIVVHATYGLGSGVQCQRLDGGGIGVQAIVDAGFIDAVDIWGYVEQGVEVCFPQAGELLFLDARMMPRAIVPLAAQTVNGMTCGAIERPGSIVLVPPS